MTFILEIIFKHQHRDTDQKGKEARATATHLETREYTNILTSNRGKNQDINPSEN